MDDVRQVTCKDIAKTLLRSAKKSVDFMVESEDGWHYTAVLTNAFDANVLIIGYWGGGSIAAYDVTIDVDEIEDTIKYYLDTLKEDTTTLYMKDAPTLPLEQIIEPLDMCAALYGYTIIQIAEQFAISYDIKPVVTQVIQDDDFGCYLHLRGGYTMGIGVSGWLPDKDDMVYKDGEPYKTITELMKGK